MPNDDPARDPCNSRVGGHTAVTYRVQPTGEHTAERKSARIGLPPPPKRPVHAATKGCRPCTGVSGSGGAACPWVSEKTRATPVQHPCATTSHTALEARGMISSAPGIGGRSLEKSVEDRISFSVRIENVKCPARTTKSTRPLR